MAAPIAPGVINLTGLKSGGGKKKQSGPGQIPVPPPAPGGGPRMQPEAAAVMVPQVHGPAMPYGAHLVPALQQQHMPHPMHPHAHQPAIPLPTALVPLQHRERQTVSYSDIRDETRTDTQAREELSRWVILRFEKFLEKEYNEYGEPLPPTWENVVRTEVRDVLKQDAARCVRDLDRKESLAAKKAGLLPAQQRQLEKAQEELQRSELDPRYHFVLAQVDWQLKRVDERSKEYREHEYHKVISSSSKPSSSKGSKDAKKVIIARKRSTRSRSTSKDRSKKKHKRVYERMSLTAYFKRTPRPDENVHAMLKEHNDLTRRKSLHYAQHPVGMHLPPQQFPPPQHPVQVKMQQQHKHHKQPHIVQVIPHGKKAGIKIIRSGRDSPRSSRSSRSSYSDDDLYSLGGSEYTQDTSVDSSVSSGHRHHHHHHRRRRSRSRHRPEQFGIEVLPRRHSRHEQQHFIQDDHPARLPPVPAPPSPVLLPPAFDIEALQDEAYHAGRLDERAQARVLPEPYRPRLAPAPRIIQRQPSFRLVEPQDFVRERHEDTLYQLDRLAFDDDIRYDEQRRSDEDLAAQRREDEFYRREALRERMRRERIDRDSAVFDDLDLERVPRDFGRRRGSVRIPARDDAPNPFTPVGARGRRRDSMYV